MTPRLFLDLHIPNEEGCKINEKMKRGPRPVGKLGRLLRFNAEKQRWAVVLEDGAKKISVRAQNLQALEPAPPKPAASTQTGPGRPAPPPPRGARSKHPDGPQPVETWDDLPVEEEEEEPAAEEDPPPVQQKQSELQREDEWEEEEEEEEEEDAEPRWFGKEAEPELVAAARSLPVVVVLRGRDFAAYPQVGLYPIVTLQYKSNHLMLGFLSYSVAVFLK
jgi:hypothetical protein